MLATVGVLMLAVAGGWAAAGAKTGQEKTVGGVAGVMTEIGGHTRQLMIGGVKVQAAATSAQVTWTTSLGAQTYLAARLGTFGEQRWSPPVRGRAGQVTLHGLSPHSAYQLVVVASRDGNTVREPFVLRTKPS